MLVWDTQACPLFYTANKPILQPDSHQKTYRDGSCGSREMAEWVTGLVL